MTAMIEDIPLERAGGQDLVKRLTKLNVCGLAAAQRLAQNPNASSRFRLAAESLASYRDLSDMEIEHFASQPVFLFRPSRLTEALSYPPAPAPAPDGEVLRRFLLLLRDLVAYAVSVPVVILGLDPVDVDKAKRLTDDDFEALHGSEGLTFEPRIEPSVRLRSATVDGWDQDLFLAELLKDLNRQLNKSQKSIPKSPH
jgi:hypothetical protein